MHHSPRFLGRAAHDGTGRNASRPSSTVLIWVMMLFILIPAQPEVGSLRIDPYRLFAIILTLPLLIRIMSARDNYITASDWLMIGLAGWIILTFFVNHGPARMPYAVIAALELTGGYIAGRALIRNIEQYRALFRYMAIALMALMPFAIFEMLTSRILISEIIRPFFQVYENFSDQRFGLSRAQTVFPHPILFGLFCSIAIANFYYLYRGKPAAAGTRIALAAGMTFSSLSSGPLLSALLQLALIAWQKVSGSRWKLLAGLAVGVYVFLEIFSNRGPIILLIEHLTLNPRTAWWRVHIWNYGVENVLANPVFGIALHDWARPSWLAPTIDNFWLVIAIRHGLPGVTFLVLAIFLHMRRIAMAQLESEVLKSARTGYMVALIGIIFTLCTVHIWSSTAFFIMFYIGAGSFFYASKESDGRNDSMVESAPPEVSATTHTRKTFTRFPVRPQNPTAHQIRREFSQVVQIRRISVSTQSSCMTGPENPAC